MSLFIALEFTAAVVIRTLIAQPYTIPATSMAPTVELGDYVVAAKFPYGYSNFSLPFGHFLPEFTYAKTPAKRGDIVIFRLPSDPSTDYIKRVIGLPGDLVQIKDGVTYLNGIALKREASGKYNSANAEHSSDDSYKDVPLFREFLPDGTSYTVMELTDSGEGDNTPVFSVPADHYFVMGDNRDNSSDSRFSVGYVPEANVVAKAIVAITWPGGRFTMRELK